MAIQPIRLFGDPILATRAVEVDSFDRELQRLVADLTETMLDSPGAGLAAPQIGVSLRVFTWAIEEQVGHLINPVLTLGEEIQEGDEGCLSIPGLTYNCPRAFHVVAKGFTLHGEPVTFIGEEMLARIFQHETDHLNGILFVDRLEKEERKRALHDIKESDWFGLNSPEIRISPHSTRGFGV